MKKISEVLGIERPPKCWDDIQPFQLKTGIGGRDSLVYGFDIKFFPHSSVILSIWTATLACKPDHFLDRADLSSEAGFVVYRSLYLLGVNFRWSRTERLKNRTINYSDTTRPQRS
ncbi:hypothetical protein KY284_037330 [Solanum tuberosum]|nr:hypothetical protein KY284_037330 [Solanum tuberosum]